MSFLEQEIAEQPAVLRRLMAEEAETVRRIGAAVREFNPTFVSIAARGTSDNAARYIQYLLGVHAGLSVALATPSIHTLYETSPNLSRALVIGISQSGQSADVCQVVQDARAQGALTVAITNDPVSPIAQAAAFHINLHAGAEQSVAATKTYTAQLTAGAMLVAALTESAEMHGGLSELPDIVQDTLTSAEQVRNWVERYRYINQFACIGRGYNYCTAFEISLKVQELCYVTGLGYSEADFLHGPIAMLQPGFPVMIIAPDGRTLPTIREFLGKLRDKQVERLVISNVEALREDSKQFMPLPSGIPEWLTPIPAVLPGQMFAMLLAAAKGNPLDKPHGLTKVTITR
jgi:glucosamine--fructose-6-phosphate aminotransferase (isomerizing)